MLGYYICGLLREIANQTHNDRESTYDEKTNHSFQETFWNTWHNTLIYAFQICLL